MNGFFSNGGCGCGCNDIILLLLPCCSFSAAAAEATSAATTAASKRKSPRLRGDFSYRIDCAFLSAQTFQFLHLVGNDDFGRVDIGYLHGEVHALARHTVGHIDVHAKSVVLKV